MTKTAIVTCARCGLPRKFTRKGAVLCMDCKYTMTQKEVAQWNTKAPSLRA